MTYEQRFDAGMAALRERQLRAAIEFLQGCTAEHPEDPRAHLHLGRALEMAGLDDDAEAAFTRAAELDPRNPDAHVHLGRVWWRGGRLDEARIGFERALVLEPRHTVARADLADLSFRPGVPPIAAPASLTAPGSARWVRILGVTPVSSVRTVGLAIFVTGVLVGAACAAAAHAADLFLFVLLGFSLPFTFTWLPGLLAALHNALVGRRGRAGLLLKQRGADMSVEQLDGASVAGVAGVLAALGLLVTAVALKGLSVVSDSYVSDPLQEWAAMAIPAVPVCALLGAVMVGVVRWQVTRYNRRAARLGWIRVVPHVAGTHIEVRRLPVRTFVAAALPPLVVASFAGALIAPVCCDALVPHDTALLAWVCLVVPLASLCLVSSFNLFAHRFGGLELTVKEA